MLIDECGDQFFECLTQPEGYGSRIDQARDGLEGVLLNLSGLDVPVAYASSHALLQQGLASVIEGLSLYATGIRELDLDKLEDASELVRSGKQDIDKATSDIASQPSGGVDLTLLLTLTGGVAVPVMGVLLFILVRQVRKTQRAYVERELATCPICGEVLDRWWTYRTKQVRAWLATHTRSHEKVQEGFES